ncbi:cytochrome b [Rhodothalassium salexigens DSM 2132]|uniref:Cytochrome b n=1 Tax=Rhodothalassium salexigens DSM 2132 TaxID=1188247 RepID=A0A4V2SPS0_RHOSA|nr:cytochrome b/b6 domain-containing protein [Rhodothalassium salexigens]MBB4211138.1 cytochrome b [Rhodothalassium salexigens DSM 2132]MBK1637479.1 hypothetical protein [Rhodothalassium salexigens DSM 2132]TCP36206.1 cytochrome b [Rhodothalassium salexigens DSM 2132]
MAKGPDAGRLWDLPTRLFHWTLALGIVAAWWTAENGELELHEKVGLFLLSLIIFRVLWGLVGSPTARFARFLTGPGPVLRHLVDLWQQRQHVSPGHNPAGGWMVVVLLAAVFAQAVMGLFASDDFLFWGPLAGLVSSDWVGTLTGWHKSWFNVILGLIALHVLAVLYYVFLAGEDLIRAMITGRKPGLSAERTPGDRVLAGPRTVALRALACLAAAVALGWGGVGLIETLAA